MRAAVRLLRTDGPAHDLVLVHDPELLVAVRLAGIDRLPPVVWDVHEDTAAALLGRRWVPGPLRRPLGALVRRWERWAERALHLLLAEDAYQDRFRRAHPVVRNYPWSISRAAVRVDARADVTPRTSAEHAPAAGAAPARAVYVGRLSHARGLDELIALGRRLAGTGIQVELAGPCDEDRRVALEQAVAEGAVVWHGFVPNDRIGPLLDGALAGLSLLHDEPNYRVSLPTKVVEYLAHGIPVVATPLPLVAALLADGGGVIVPEGDVEAVSEVLMRLQDDPLWHRRLSRRATELAEERTWEREGARFVAFLGGWLRS